MRKIIQIALGILLVIILIPVLGFLGELLLLAFLNIGAMLTH
mgnify:FL=1